MYNVREFIMFGLFFMTIFGLLSFGVISDNEIDYNEPFSFNDLVELVNRTNSKILNNFNKTQLVELFLQELIRKNISYSNTSTYKLYKLFIYEFDKTLDPAEQFRNTSWYEKYL